MDFLGINSRKKAVPVPPFEYITKEEDARRVLSEIDRQPVIEFDTEGTALDPYVCRTTLVQIGVPGRAYVFDIRNDLPDISIHGSLFKDILTDKKKLKLLQNCNYDMKVLKAQFGYYIENVYDTMLAEQLMSLGVQERGFALGNLVEKYLGLYMDKEPRGTFSDYYQQFTPTQLAYAASDVCVLDVIRHMQMPKIEYYNLQGALQLEFDFTKPLAEMELNGIGFDVAKWRVIMKDVELEYKQLKHSIEESLVVVQDQTTLFGVSSINIDSPEQLKEALNKLGLPMENTDKGALEKYEGHPVVDDILAYRKLSKLITTYNEALIARIHPVTGKLHTQFRQMISTGRMSSNNPNLQNIPAKQKFRTCFVAANDDEELITDDMSGAELRIMGDMSGEPNFIKAYTEDIDLHTLNAANVFKVTYDKVTPYQRKASKAVTFGLCYGMSAVGLAARLRIPKKEAEDIISGYFEANKDLYFWLESAGKNAVKNKYSESISGRKRFYSIPNSEDPNRGKIIGAVGRQGKNAPIQGCLVSDTKVKGVGCIGECVGQKVELNTGFGVDTAAGVYSGKKTVYNLELTNGNKLGITSTHKVPVCTADGLVEKSVRQIKLGEDCLLIPLDPQEGTATVLKGYKYKKGHRRETYKSIKLPEVMSKQLAFIIGCLIGDGSYSSYNRAAFVCALFASELFDKYNSYVEDVFKFKPFTKKVSRYSKKHARKTTLLESSISSVVIRGFLKHIGLGYVTGVAKKVPGYFYTETIENKGALLNGLFSTDGSVTKESGPNYTTISKQLANDVQQLLLSLGINSNLKTYIEEGRLVYRLQIPKRFNNKFKKLVGFSVELKNRKLDAELLLPKFGDRSIVPKFIPKMIAKELRDTGVLAKLSQKKKAQVRAFSKGGCSFTSWRLLYRLLPEGAVKRYLSAFLNFDFCTATKLTYRGVEDTYDLMCDNIHYFVANGVVVHNSNADTIKKAMVLCVDRLEELNCGAKLLLTVHDEIIVSTPKANREAVAKIVSSSLVDGFSHYFHKIPMEADAVLGPCWIKSKCENEILNGKKCGGKEFEFAPDAKYGTKLVCKKCGAEQK